MSLPPNFHVFSEDAIPKELLPGLLLKYVQQRSIAARLGHLWYGLRKDLAHVFSMH